MNMGHTIFAAKKQTIFLKNVVLLMINSCLAVKLLVCQVYVKILRYSDRLETLFLSFITP